MTKKNEAERKTNKYMLKHMKTAKYKKARLNYIKKNKEELAEYNRTYLKTRRWEARRNKICQRCFKVSVADMKRTHCDACAEKQTKKYYEKLGGCSDEKKTTKKTKTTE